MSANKYVKNFLETVETIKSKLQEKGFNSEAAEILQLQLNLGTPGEVFGRVAFYLNNLKKNKPNAYTLAPDEIDGIVLYAKEINYIQ